MKLRPLARRYGPALAASTLLGALCIRAILRAAGGPAAPLDDAFIHLQFARQLGHGHPFQYVDGAGYSSGATSFLWPVLLAPFHALGLRDVSLLWATWLLGTVAHAGVAVEAYDLARRLAGKAAALGAAAMCILFGAFAWFAWSGMETMGLAWIVLRTARAAAARCEPDASGTEVPSDRELMLLGILAPLVRPEGALASLVAAIALLKTATPKRRALVPLIGPLVVPLMNLAFTGHASSATTQVKWMIGNPYYSAAAVLATTATNAHTLLLSIIDGGDWTTIFLPEHANIPILLGAIALPLATRRRGAPWHGLFVAMVALGSFIPCTYSTFLWNRVRYVWPFAGSWFVLVACAAREAGDLARILWPRATAVTPLLAGACAAALASRLPWTIQDLATSAAAITNQQVKLGRWAATSLPADARIGVNDTGAIAYLSHRRTFDVVGLTTEGEARYWVGGAASRFEHYERLPADRRPTHFIVYPNWMACSPVLGRELTEATVTDQTILGGATMVAYEARWDLLGSGALPGAPPPGLVLVDEVDVADLDSERAHGFELGDGWDTDEVLVAHGLEVRRVDGGRLRRARDRFHVKLPNSSDVALWMRVSTDVPTSLAVTVGGRQVGVVPIDVERGWVEASLKLPADVASEKAEVSIQAVSTGEGEDAGRFGSFHYWVFAGSSGSGAGAP